MAKARLVERKVVAGTVRLPAGSIDRGVDAHGRRVFAGSDGKRWWTIRRVAGGWEVATYTGSCNC